MTLTGALMFSGLLGLLLAGVPVALALFAISLGSLLLVAGGDLSALGLVANTLWNAITPFTLSSVPLYILMGALISASGLGARLYGAVAILTSGLPGGLAVATTAACTIMAAISGSSVATAAAIGGFAISEMRRFGYTDAQAAGAVAAGGTLGILIPPSIPMIVYGVIAEESIGRLFLAGILPGLLMAGSFALYQVWSAWSRRGTVEEKVRSASFTERLVALVDLLPMALLIGLILGCIYTGIATPTETAALGVGASLVLALVFTRDLTSDKLVSILLETSRTTTMVLAIIAGAMLFGYALTTTDVAPRLSQAVAVSHLPPWLVFISINLLFLFLGCFLEVLSVIVITTPIIMPVVTAFGWDKVWFGVILVINMEMALIHPPMGLNLFIVKSVAPSIPLTRIMIGALPYVAIMALILAAVALMPGVFS